MHEGRNGMSAASPHILVVGAGPAGVRAAETLVAHGLRPIVIDEAPRSGGQVYRQQPPGFRRPSKTLYGFEAKKASAVHGSFAALQGKIDHRPETVVWNIENRTAYTLGPEGVERIPYDSLLLATGAMDRIVPFPGWTTPGVFTLGGSQVALKAQGCAIGKRVVFLGTGPLLYLVSYQYAHAGAEVAAALDTARLADALPVIPGLLAGRGTFLKGLWYQNWLRLKGIPLARGITPVAVERDGRVEAVRYRTAGGRERHVACDALAFGWGVKSECQLAELAGAEMAFDPLARQWLPTVDTDGRATTKGLYLAGDGASVMGADAAELRGELAALALLEDRGIAVPKRRQKKLRAVLRRLMRFRAALEHALPFPDGLAPSLPDDTIVCRCEIIRAGDIRAGHALSPQEINRAKAFTRIGMGRCQGRVCGIAAAQILAYELGVPLAEVGRLRGQAPIKPLPIGVAALAAVEDPERAVSI